MQKMKPMIFLKAMRELEKLGISTGGRQRLEEERKKLKASLEAQEKGINNMKEMKEKL